MTGTRHTPNASGTARVTNLVVLSSTQLRATVEWTWTPGASGNGAVDRPNIGLNAGTTPIYAANVRAETQAVPAAGTYTKDITLNVTSTPATFVLWINIWYSFSGNTRSATDSITFEWSNAVTINSARDDWDLEQEYDDDCVLQENHDNTTRHEEDIGAWPLTSGGNLASPPTSSSYGSSHVDETLAATTRTITGKNACTADSPGYLKFDGTVTETLSEEYTEDDAIAKFVASHSFGSWTTVSPSGCMGGGQSCCLAQYEERTDDSFLYSEAEYRVNGSGLIPLSNYDVEVKVYRRAFGTGSFVLFQTISFTLTTDIDGNFTYDDTVPNEAGYETYAGDACAKLSP